MSACVWFKGGPGVGNNVCPNRTNRWAFAFQSRNPARCALKRGGGQTRTTNIYKSLYVYHKFASLFFKFQWTKLKFTINPTNRICALSIWQTLPKALFFFFFLLPAWVLLTRKRGRKADAILVRSFAFNSLIFYFISIFARGGALCELTMASLLIYVRCSARVSFFYDLTLW